MNNEIEKLKERVRKLESLVESLVETIELIVLGEDEV